MAIAPTLFNERLQFVLDSGSVIPVLNIITGPIKVIYALALAVINGVNGLRQEGVNRSACFKAATDNLKEAGLSVAQAIPLIGNLVSIGLVRSRYPVTQTS